MSAAILEGRTLRAYTDGLGRLSAALCESAEIIASGGAASGSPRPDSEDTGRGAGTTPAPCAVPMPLDPLEYLGTDPALEEYQRTHYWDGTRRVEVEV